MKNHNFVRQKVEVRKEIIRRLRDQEPQLRAERSKIIQNKLLSSEEFRVCRIIMSYVSLPTEVDTEYLIKEALKQGKRVAVPRIESDNPQMTALEITSLENLEKGHLGIYQPSKSCKKITLKEIDLIVVPALAFDKNNKRLGRGKGYYDRFLSTKGLCSEHIIGLGFSFQVLDSIPCDSHDKPVTKIITD